jgi:hypothetical protein
MPKGTFVRRDRFAREELWKDRLYHPMSTCQRCGSVALFRGRRCLYQFTRVPDAGRSLPGSRLFCSLPCYEGFYSP